MNRAWENVAAMTPGGAVEAAYTVGGIEYIEVAKIVPGHSGGTKVGELRPGDPNPDDLEQYVLRNWGPGVYALSPVWRNHRIRTRSYPFGGEAAFANAVTGAVSGDELANVDKQIADALRRESATSTLERMMKVKQEASEMTPEQLERILEKVVSKPASGPDPLVGVLQQQNAFMMEMLKMERDRSDKLMAAAAAEKSAPTDPNTLLGLGAVLVPLLGKLPAKSLGMMLNGVMRFLRPQEAPPESGWTPEQVMATIQMAGPLVQGVLAPVLESIRAALTGMPTSAPSTAPVSTGPTAIPAAAPITTNGGGIVPIALNAEEKMSMDLFFQFLGQMDYESCWSTLGTTEKTVMLNFAVMELKDKQRPESLLPLFLRFDVRAQGQIHAITEYLIWAKTVKKPEVEKEDEEADAADAAEGGERA